MCACVYLDFEWKPVPNVEQYDNNDRPRKTEHQHIQKDRYRSRIEIPKNLIISPLICTMHGTYIHPIRVVPSQASVDGDK